MARAPVINPPASTLLALYRTMVMARAIERRLWVLERLERMAPSIRVTGFEALQVAAAAALRPGRDWVVSGPLDLALRLAMGMSPLDVMLAVFEKASPYTSSASRLVNTPAMGGRHVAQAAGIAYATQVSGRDEVTLVCTDERGIYTGDWHEGLNFAGAHGLPLICLVEEIAGGSRPIARHLEASPATRAEGYGLAAETLDGGDFGAASAAFSRAAERARSNGGPTLIHALVPELTSTAPGGGLRPPEELEAQAWQDPIDRMRRRLAAAGGLSDDADDGIQRESARAIAAAVVEARQAPSPEGAQALDNVFSSDLVG